MKFLYNVANGCRQVCRRMPLFARIAAASIIGGVIFSLIYWLISTIYFAFSSADSYLLLISIGLSIAFVCIPQKAEAAIPKENSNAYRRRSSADNSVSASSEKYQGGSTFQEVFDEFANATPNTNGIEPEDDYFPNADDDFGESVAEAPIY